MQNKTDISLSKLLSWLLRHGAVKEGLHIDAEGFVAVSCILNHSSLKSKYSVEDIIRVVEKNDKKRFTLRKNCTSNSLEIKANQGHSLNNVSSLHLVEIINSSEVPVVVHGTYIRNWDSIKRNGLSRMQRNHIHFAKGFNSPNNAVISGMRNDCQLHIYINVELALRDGLRFFKSENDVILSPGDEFGVIHPKYFLKVFDVSKSKIYIL